MKLRIVNKQLNELSEYQKQRLNTVWIPEKYDLVVAKICIDAINAKFEDYEFVIGDIEVFESVYHELYVTLWDIKSTAQERDENQNLLYAEDQYDEETNDLNIDNSLKMIQPSSFNKEECLPLLNIGQMIKILHNLRYGEGCFYLDLHHEKESGIGTDIYTYHNRGNESQGKEICDVLWEKIKSLL